MSAVAQRGLATRQLDPARGLPVPFANEDDTGRVDHAMVVKKRAIRCALSRICGVCGTSLTWPVAFIGEPAEAADNLFIYPPLHPACADEAVATFGGVAGGVLGHAQAVSHWQTILTGGFDLVRPTVHGAPVMFRPNSPIEN